MGFVDQFEFIQEPSWNKTYIPYNTLSDKLDKCSKQVILIKQDQLTNDIHKSNINPSTDDISYTKLIDMPSLLNSFHSHLEENLDIVQHNFENSISNIKEHLRYIDLQLSNFKTKDDSNNFLPTILLDLWKEYDDLNEYIMVNKLALLKLITKRDTLFFNNIENLPDKTIYLNYFDLIKTDYSTKDLIIKLYVVAKQNINLNEANIFNLNKNGTDDKFKTSFDVDGFPNLQNFELEAEIEHINQSKFSTQSRLQSNFLFSLFSGISIVLLMNLCFVLQLPTRNHEFSVEGALAIFPVFRVVILFIFVIWGSGISMSIMDRYNVNYKFMMDFDPNCKVNPSLIFTLASIQTTIWIIMFTLFMLDYKLNIHIIKYVFNSKPNLWIYPLILIILQLLTFLIPSKIFSNSYKISTLKSLLNVFSHGIVPKICIVTLRSNVIGDIFATLSRPFGDIEYSLTLYYIIWKNNGDIKPESLFFFLSKYRWMQTAVLTLPYEIRFFQCFMRYVTDKSSSRKNHLYNMGKYTFGMLVSIVATLPWSNLTNLSKFTIRFIWFTIYIIATIYMFAWDILMDWGLFKENNNLVRSLSMYPKWYYYIVAFYNLIGRLTWAITLIPITIIDDIKINAIIIQFLVVTVEIIRRSLWCTIRLEWEQVHLNPTKPAIYWVKKNKN